MKNPPGFSDCRIDADNDAVVDCLDACVDADEDGVGNGTNGNSSCAAQTVVDSNDDDPEKCAETDADTCDDCVSQTFDPTNEGATPTRTACATLATPMRQRRTSS